ncbi:MAG: thiamine-phosphate kinase [Methyloceanibacter sp.]|uniref:thiamine-phosphate kinase n=1 Tax=Methyloceanibacter sp. TaxID=1965321 RepID=UPI003D6D435F
MAKRTERTATKGADEFDIIARYFAPLAKDTAALGLRDDAAVLMVSEGHELVATCDTIVEGVHFLKDDPADSIGHKALAVNLSDLTAKGSRGYVYLLSLALPPDVSPAWLEGFASGLRDIQDRTGISLIGGDTTASPGPLTITIAALGLVSHDHAVMRLGAKPGDRLYVSGTIGDACLGLRLLREPGLAPSWALTKNDVAFLVEAYRRPGPNNDLAVLVRNFAQAAIDVSDGLIGDIEKLCNVSHVGARIEAARVPFSAAARKALAREPGLLPVLITAGDDYGVVMAVSERSAADFESEAGAKGAAFTLIGEVVPAGEGIAVLDGEGQALKLKRKGFSHF